MDRITFFDAPITTQFIPKKKLIHDFIDSWKFDHIENSLIQQFCASHKNLNTQNIIITEEMHGFTYPGMQKFYGPLAEFIGVLFLINATPFDCTYKCIGTPDNILAFRYLFRQVRKQEHEDWKKYDKSVRSYSLWTWDDDYSAFINEKYIRLVEESKSRSAQHKFTNLTPEIRRWYRQFCKINNYY